MKRAVFAFVFFSVLAVGVVHAQQNSVVMNASHIDNMTSATFAEMHSAIASTNARMAAILADAQWNLIWRELNAFSRCWGCIHDDASTR